MQQIRNPACWGLVSIALLVGSAAAEAIKVGFGVDRPPYVIEKKQSGIEVEIVERAAEKAGLQVIPVFANHERTQRMLSHGELMAETSMQPTADNRDLFFSAAYIEYQDCAFALSARKLVVGSIADMGKYSVSAFQLAQQDLGAEYQSMVAANPSYHEYADEQFRTLLLFSGRTDLLVGDKYIFEYFRRKIPEVSRVNNHQPVTVYPLWAPVPFYVRFARADLRNRFDQGLRLLRQTGEYQAIFKKYSLD